MIKKMFCSFIFSIILINFATATPIKIIAAENFYGELAKEIGGDKVSVQSILNNPDADPHLFTTSPKTSKALDEAQIIIYNGVNYDPWMEQMLQSLANKNVIIINVADLMQLKNSNINPHIWYMPNTFPTLAQVLSDKIAALDPTAKITLKGNLNKFLVEHQVIVDQIAQLKKKYSGTKVTATEPVFGYLASAMGLDMLGVDFQWKIMNNTEPTPKMLAQYEALLTQKTVKILFYNSQVTDPITANILAIAKANSIAIVGVTETMPQQMTVNQWLTSEITKTNNALKAIK